jgi:hypothetical protein
VTEHLVIVGLVDGYADTSIVHQPAPLKKCGGHGQISFKFAHNNSIPRTWPSLCGHVTHGWVYNHGGVLQDAPMCWDCRIAKLVGEA